MRRAVAMGLVTLPVGMALLAPAPPREGAAASPVAAATRAESTIGPLGLSWGRLRGWRRVGDGWALVWQPAHGAWLLRVWLPDGAGDPAWRLDAATWLPGARLSRAAASLMLAWPEGSGVPEERLGRRDWTLDGGRLLGALPAGGEVPGPPGWRGAPWDAVLVGLLLAGTVARVVFPALPVRLSRRTVSWLTVAVGACLPWMSPLAVDFFQVGVRPWVAQLAVGAVSALVLGAVVLAIVAFPAAYARPAAAPLAVAFSVGLLAGRIAPPTWVPSVEALTVRLVPLLAIVVVGGWLAAMAGDGLRLLLGGTVRYRRWLLTVLAVASVATAGDRAGVVAAVIAAAAVERPQGVWTAGFVLWGWLAAALMVGCDWPEAARDALTCLLLGVGTLGCLTLAEFRWVADGAAETSA